MRYFSEAWVNGSKNYKSSNAIDHANSEPHKLAMSHYRDAVKMGEIKAVSEILFCEGLVRLSTNEYGDVIEDLEFADYHISNLRQRFIVPLEHAGTTCDEVELGEWHELISYLKKCFAPAITNYLKTWKMIFSSSRANTDFKTFFFSSSYVFVCR